MPGVARAMMLVTPKPHSGSRSSSSKVMRSGTRRASASSFQKRFEKPAKWWPVNADRMPGLIPTNSTRTPGSNRSRKIRSMAQWLVKEEPEHYSYDQLEQDRKTVWAGVRNPLAQKHLRGIKKGDRIFYYHTGKQKAVVALARAAGNAYPDPNDKTGKLYVVDITADRKLARPVTLA